MLRRRSVVLSAGRRRRSELCRLLLSPRLRGVTAPRLGGLSGDALRSVGHALLLPLLLLRRLELMLPLRRLRWLRPILDLLLRVRLRLRPLLQLCGRCGRGLCGGHRTGGVIRRTGGLLHTARGRTGAGPDPLIALDIRKRLSGSGLKSQQGGLPAGGIVRIRAGCGRIPVAGGILSGGQIDIVLRVVGILRVEGVLDRLLLTG